MVVWNTRRHRTTRIIAEGKQCLLADGMNDDKVWIEYFNHGFERTNDNEMRGEGRTTSCRFWNRLLSSCCWMMRECDHCVCAFLLLMPSFKTSHIADGLLFFFSFDGLIDWTIVSSGSTQGKQQKQQRDEEWNPKWKQSAFFFVK